MAQERRGQDRLKKLLGAPDHGTNTRATTQPQDRQSGKELIKFRSPDRTEIIRQRENDLYERQSS